MLTQVRRFDRYQQRHRVLAVALAVVKKASEDGAGSSAALIAYYGFLALFPLLLAAVAILGFVAQSDASARKTIVGSGLGNIPIVGDWLARGSGHIAGSGLGLAIGLLAALWAGLGVTLALQRAFNQANLVRYQQRANFLVARLRGARLLLVVGLLELVATSLTGVLSAGVAGAVLVVLGFVVTLLFNAALFAIAFRVLTDERVPTRELWPGVAFATAGWVLLQALGSLYVRHLAHSATYGSFAGVIGLLVWLILGARIVVYAAELNVVLARGYWPRSLLAEETEADHRVRLALSEVEDPIESVDAPS